MFQIYKQLMHIYVHVNIRNDLSYFTCVMYLFDMINCWLIMIIVVDIVSFQTHFCVPETREFQRESDFTKLCATIECQQPIPDLYKFIGRITVYNNSNSVLKSLGPENVLLRGARLKNTPYIYGNRTPSFSIFSQCSSRVLMNSFHSMWYKLIRIFIKLYFS